jgi:hypothetical protein
VEAKVSALSGSYTNAMELKAKFTVLQERALLKYAALDCWQLVAQELPAGIPLQRLSFTDGRKLALGGQVGQEDTQKVIDFYDALRKGKLNGQPVFEATPLDQLVYRQSGNTVVWNFALQLLHTEAQP